MNKHKVFISYHHDNDQEYKNKLLELNKEHEIFIDRSVDTGDIDDNLTDESKRIKIRDEYLRDSTVTILLVGTETKNRKHIDWEIYSSMIDGLVNKKSGIIAINLPGECSLEENCHAPHGDAEKNEIHPDISHWKNYSIEQNKKRFPCLPDRIIKNLCDKVSVIQWNKIVSDPDKLRLLIQFAYDNRENCKYDLSDPMRRNNS